MSNILKISIYIFIQLSNKQKSTAAEEEQDNTSPFKYRKTYIFCIFMGCLLAQSRNKIQVGNFLLCLPGNRLIVAG